MPKAVSKSAPKKLSRTKKLSGTKSSTGVKTRQQPRKKSSPGRTPKNVVNVDGRDRRPWALASKERLLEAATEEIADSSAWMMKLALTVPRNAGDSGPTSAQQLLVEAYYASWRDPAAREMLEPRIHEHYAMYRKIVADAQSEGAIDKKLDPHLLATLLLAIPLGMALANMAGLDRPDDASWLDVGARFDVAMRPVKKR